VSRVLSLAAFLVLVLAILGGMHWFLWARLARDTALPELGRRLAGLLLALVVAGIPAGMAVARRLPASSTRLLLTVLFTWMGFAFLLFVALLAADVARLLWASGQWAAVLASGKASPPPDPGRRVFLARAIAGGAVAVAGAATATALRAAAGDVRVVEVPVRLERLPAALSGFTLAQISDLHVGLTIGERHVRQVVEATNALRPDAIVITGDLVDGRVADLRRATELLARLAAPQGVYFVTGNHEYYSGVRPWLAELARYGIRPLGNGRVSLGDRGPGGSSFDLAGVDDWSVARAHDGRWPALDAALAGRDPDRSLVLLAHQPRGVAEAVRAGVELQLSGHTHGGQIFPWNLVVSAVYPYCRGLYTHREADRLGRVYVSCGTGYWGPPMRLGAPAEIGRIVLTS